MIKFWQRALCSALVLPIAAFAFSFDRDSYYASNATVINQYATDGTLLDSLTPQSSLSPDAELRGIAFGRDHLLYVVRNRDSWTPGAPEEGVIEAMDFKGQVRRTYTLPAGLGQCGCGQIAFDRSGENFYVVSGSGIARFNIHSSQGTAIIQEGPIGGMTIMPNGDLLVAGNDQLKRYTSSGVLVATIAGPEQAQISDPLKLTSAYNQIPDNEISLVSTTGVAYDQATNTIFVSMLGYHSGPRPKVDMRDKVLAIDGDTWALKAINTYTGVSNLILTTQGQLLMGSRFQSPASLDMNLQSMIAFGGPPARFLAVVPASEGEHHAQHHGFERQIAKCARNEKAHHHLICKAPRR